MIDLKKIKEIYERGENILKYLRSIQHKNRNDKDDILISYDFQAGSYTRFYEQNKDFVQCYTKYLAGYLKKIGTFDSLLEVGTGEATTFVSLLKQMEHIPSYTAGLDISLSRILYARKFVEKYGIQNITLFVGDMFRMPYANDAIDVVFTSHAVEPNGGREKEALQELYRVARKYVVLLEPIYEFATPEGQARMREHGYIRNLHKTALDLGYSIEEYKPFDLTYNPLNPTGILIIRKKSNKNIPAQSIPQWVCPMSKTPLIPAGKCYYYSPDGLLAYPVISDIPILLEEKAVVATHITEFL